MSEHRPPDLEQLYAALTGEPLCLSFEQIGKLTDRQIYDVLLYPRDEKGALRPKHVEPLFPDLPPTRENQRRVLFTEGAMLGIPHEELERVWREKWGNDDGEGT